MRAVDSDRTAGTFLAQNAIGLLFTLLAKKLPRPLRKLNLRLGSGEISLLLRDPVTNIVVAIRAVPLDPLPLDC